MSESENRKELRVRATIFTTVYELKGRVLLGFLGDLTLQGAMVIGEKQVEIDRDISLQIEFHGADKIPEDRLTIPAHVAWCKKEKKSNYYHTGFEFRDLSDLNKETIEYLVARYKFS